MMSSNSNLMSYAFSPFTQFCVGMELYIVVGSQITSVTLALLRRDDTDEEGALSHYL